MLQFEKTIIPKGWEQTLIPRGKRSTARVSVHLRLPNGGTFGNEDFSLIEAIRLQRSIIGASRALRLSYRKCWLMVDTMNRTFERPVVTTYPGRREGGAEITAFGQRLVDLYSSIEKNAAHSAQRSLEELTDALDWSFEPKAPAGTKERNLH
jgi:molybdate transport system regulatory protein